MNPLQQLRACGQSPWLDFVTRSLIETGGLRALVEQAALAGVTSNPSIFEKAIGESGEYTEAIARLHAASRVSAAEIYEHLAVADIRAAADTLLPVYNATRGRDGFVSLECSPYLADDTQSTVVEALRLWNDVGRPNLMVKVPATPAGIPAIRRLIGLGVNVNVTLLFAVNVYEQVAEAYIAGLEERGGDVGNVASVASFFISRIDSAVDKHLDKLADKEAARGLRGKTAIANAKVAYTRYKALFAGRRWEQLASAGARTQRLLWASTSTKNPAYRDTLYVEELVGRDTVNTMPPATLEAFRDHGEVRPDAVERDVDEAAATLAALERHGVSLRAVTEDLREEGVKLFADAFSKLLAAIERQRGA